MNTYLVGVFTPAIILLTEEILAIGSLVAGLEAVIT